MRQTPEMDWRLVLLTTAVVVVAVEGASLCGAGGCKDAELPNTQEDAEPRENLEVEPPVEERDVTRTSAIHPWPNAEVHYAVWGSDDTKTKVGNALNNIMSNTCVNFTQRAGQARYLLIKEGTGGCWTSSLGYPSSDTKVTINLGPGCVHAGQIKHEVMHALGFPHEHTRPDRADYVSVKWGNIKESAKSQYYINDQYPTMSVPYDLNSIMHYGKFDFAVDKKSPTMVPDPWVEGRLGSDTLSWRDKRKVSIFYDCL